MKEEEEEESVEEGQVDLKAHTTEPHTAEIEGEKSGDGRPIVFGFRTKKTEEGVLNRYAE